MRGTSASNRGWVGTFLGSRFSGDSEIYGHPEAWAVQTHELDAAALFPPPHHHHTFPVLLLGQRLPSLLVPSINGLMDHVASSVAEFFTHGKFSNHFTPVTVEEAFGGIPQCHFHFQRHRKLLEAAFQILDLKWHGLTAELGRVLRGLKMETWKLSWTVGIIWSMQRADARGWTRPSDWWFHVF